MSALNFDNLYKELFSGVEGLAKDSLHDYESEAKADGQKALDDIKTNLQQWAKEMETGSITKADQSLLLQEEAALNEMRSLKQAGLAEVRVETLRNGVTNQIMGTITGLVKL